MEEKRGIGKEETRRKECREGEGGKTKEGEGRKRKGRAGQSPVFTKCSPGQAAE